MHVEFRVDETAQSSCAPSADPAAVRHWNIKASKRRLSCTKMATLTWFERLRLNLWIMLMNAVIRILVREPPRSGLLPATTDLTPTLRLRVPSRSDPKRTIAVNVFYPPDVKPGSGEKLPVHLNAHGSGFCFKNFGECVTDLNCKRAHTHRSLPTETPSSQRI